MIFCCTGQNLRTELGTIALSAGALPEMWPKPDLWYSPVLHQQMRLHRALLFQVNPLCISARIAEKCLEIGRESAVGNLMTPFFPCCHIWKTIFCRRGSCALPERSGMKSGQWLIFQTLGRVIDSSATQRTDNLLWCNMDHRDRVTESLYPVVSGRHTTVTQYKGFILWEL